MKYVVLAAAVAVVMATGTAHAAADGCAVVLQTPDGFLNLRAEPKMGSRIIARLKPGNWFVDDDRPGGDRNTWDHVVSVPRLERGPKLSIKGWVARRFIVPVDCDLLDAPTTAD